MGYSGADVARFLGVTTSALNRLAASEELPEIKLFWNQRYILKKQQVTSPIIV